MKKILYFNILLLGVILLRSQFGPISYIDREKEERISPTLNLPEPPSQFSLDEQLHILLWRDYIPSDVIELFTSRYGTELDLTFYESNEELLTLYQSNPEKYDLMMPSEYVVSQMIRENQLTQLDHSNIPLIENIRDDIMQLEYDPGLRYSLPLFQFALGIAFNDNYLMDFPRDWDILFKHGKNPFMTFRIAAKKEMRPILGIALQLLGYSANTMNPNEIDQARDFLILQREKIGFELLADDSAKRLIQNDILLAITWNGSCGYAMSGNPHIRFVLPEGTTISSFDCFVINSKSRKKNTAEFFLNYLLVPEITARMTNFSYYANTNSTALPYVDRTIRNGPSYLFPENEQILFLKDVGESLPVYESAWQAILDTIPPDSLIHLPIPKGGIMDDFIDQTKKSHAARSGMRSSKQRGMKIIDFE